MTIQTDALESVCDRVLNLDSNIVFVGIIDDKGKLLAQSKKNKTDTRWLGLQDEVLLMEIALGVRMRREHDRHIGPQDFTISYGPIITMIFPLDKEILYIYIEKRSDVLKVAFLIMRLLKAEFSQRAR